MAVRFDAATDGLSYGTPVPGNFTITCWAYLEVDRNDFSCVTSIENSATNANQYYLLETTADGTTFRAYFTGDNLTGDYVVTVGTWHKFALTYDGTSLTFYAAAAASGITQIATGAANAVTRTVQYIGTDSFGEWWNGRIAHVRVWNTVLTSTEIGIELNSYTAVRAANLYAAWELESAAAALTDSSGNGRTLTAGSTGVTDATGPLSAGVVVKPALVSDRGTVANATAATTSAVTLSSPTTIAVGNYLLARVAVDNSGTNGAAPGCTVTDPRSNTWTVLGPALVDPGVASAGATAYLAYTKVSTAYQAADALTFNWGGISTTAKAVVVEEWSNIDKVTPVAVSAVTANAAASTAVQVSITPTVANQLVYTCLATEGIAADSFTDDADTTNGSWVTLTTTASANATATNNQRVAGSYKVVTASGAQSWDATITNRDWAALAVVFNPVPPPFRAYVFGQALTRSHYW